MAILLAILWAFFAPAGTLVASAQPPCAERQLVAAPVLTVSSVIAPDSRGPLRDFADEEAPAIVEVLDEEREEESKDSPGLLILDLGIPKADHPSFSRLSAATRQLLDPALRNVRSVRLRL